MSDNLCKVWFAPKASEKEEPAEGDEGAGTGEGQGGDADAATPTAEDYGLDVTSFTVEERIGELWQVNLTAISDQADIPLDDLVGIGAAFVMERPGTSISGERHRVWTGVCASVSQIGRQPNGSSQYAITLRPEIWRLSLRKNSRTFQHASIPEIVLKVLEDWGITEDKGGEEGNGGDEGASEPDSDGAESGDASTSEKWKAGTVKFEKRSAEVPEEVQFPKFEYRVQYEETDYTFITRLLEEAGLSLYFRHRNELKGVGREGIQLVIDSNPAGANEAALRLEDHGTSENESFGKRTPFLQNATWSRNLRPGTVTVREHDFRKAVTTPLEGVDDSGPELEQPLEHFDYTSGTLHIERLECIKAVADEKGARGFSQPYATHFASVHLGALRNNANVGTFQTNALEVAPGMVVGVGGGSLPEQVLVVGTSFSGDSADGRKARGQENKWHVVCEVVPVELPYRPSRNTPRPCIAGVQSAMVVGPPGQELFSDEFGRVRIQFHWDRQHKRGAPVETKDLIEPMGSCWVRVAAPWAGAGYGFVAIPRIGHEVLVQFLDGDPDQPIVVGSVFNPEHSPHPYPMPANDRRSVWRSKISPNSRGYNEIYLDDAAGEVHMQAQTTFSRKVGATETVDIGAQRTTKIGRTDKIEIGTSYELVVGNKIGIKVDTAEGGMIQLQVDKSLFKLTSTSLTIEVPDELHLHAKNIELSARGGEIRIEGSPNVHINRGTKCGVVNTGPIGKAAAPNGPAAGHPYVPITGGGGMPPPIGPIADDVPLVGPEPPIGSMDGVGEVLGPMQEAAGGAGQGMAALQGAGQAIGQAGQLGGQLGQVGQQVAQPGQAAGGFFSPQTLGAGVAAGAGNLVAGLLQGQNPANALKGAALGAVGAAVAPTISNAVGGGLAGQVAAVTAVGAITGGKDGVMKGAITAVSGAAGAAIAKQVVPGAAVPGARPGAAPPPAQGAAPVAPAVPAATPATPDDTVPPKVGPQGEGP